MNEVAKAIAKKFGRCSSKAATEHLELDKSWFVYELITQAKEQEKFSCFFSSLKAGYFSAPILEVNFIVVVPIWEK